MMTVLLVTGCSKTASQAYLLPEDAFYAASYTQPAAVPAVGAPLSAAPAPAETQCQSFITIAGGIKVKC